jgi:glycosyltransferase involved in cell wall biosynthesis
MKGSLVLSTYNQPAALAKVLSGLQNQVRWPDEILFADDGSDQETRSLIQGWQAGARAPVRHVWHEHKGFRKTVILNKTLAQAAGDYLVFLDGDCVPHARFIADHFALAEKGYWVQGRRCFVKEPFVPRFDLSHSSIWLWMLLGRISGATKGIRLPVPILRRDTRQRGIIGCNMAFWREDLVAVNGFDEEYAGWGIGEDSDLGTRLYHLGRPRKFVYAHSIVFHLNHPMAPRDHVAASHARLAETLRSGKIRCARGLDQYLPGNS